MGLAVEEVEGVGKHKCVDKSSKVFEKKPWGFGRFGVGDRRCMHGETMHRAGLPYVFLSIFRRVSDLTTNWGYSLFSEEAMPIFAQLKTVLVTK